MKNTLFFFVASIAVAFISCGSKPETTDTPIAKVVKNQFGLAVSEHLLTFVPAGFSVFDTIPGDLNLDQYPDMVLILKNDLEEVDSLAMDNPYERPLLLLTGQTDGTYKLAAKNNKTVMCKMCGGSFGDPYTGVTIKNGRFSVEHYGGSSWRWAKVISYLYNTEQGKWFLVRIGNDSFHSAEPDKVETTIKTDKEFGSVLFENFDWEKEY
ncbi:MAG TPA: hypothetical protein DCQ31_15730 [Bacteroidales bacterium]|nr:hypothetical protein [Bacteroidales bacterium]